MQFVHALSMLPTLITVLAFLYMGFLVFRNSRDLSNKTFLIFLGIDLAWLLTVSLVVNTSWGTSDLLSRFAFAWAVGLVMAIQAFTNALLHIQHKRAYGWFLYLGGVTVFAATVLTSGVIQDVTIRNGLPFPTYGPLYPLYVVYLLGATIVFLSALIQRWRAAKRTKNLIAKRQLDVVFAGLLAFTLISLATNFILPAAVSSSWPAQFAPVGSLVLAFSFFYAIGRYRLFDIRTAVVRSTTYLFFGGILALAFVLTANLAGSLVTAFQNHENLQQMFNAALALTIAVSFHPLKRAFDRLTNRYFFRDRYETQDVIDRLNTILISNVDMHKLLNLCESLLADKLKLDFVFVGVFTDKDKIHILSSQHVMNVRQYAPVRDQLFALPDKVVSLRNLPNTERGLHELFRTKNISAIGKMTSHDDIVGFIVFGNKKNDMPLTRQDLGVLNIAADQIAIAAQNVLRFVEIEKFNITLKDKVDDATRKLRRANDKLRKLNETKDDFISMASHQLRTPLTSVKGYVSMVLDGDAGKITRLQRRLLNQAFVSSQRMVYLISDLLNVSRLKTGKFIIEPVRCNLAKVIQEEVDQLMETARSRHLTLEYNRPEHFPVLMLDETKLRQVIMNFLDNAVYYTPAGGHIEVHLVEKPQSVEFTVVDDGIGVPRHEQHHLFTKFFRAPNAKRARPDGTGLGLFMAKKVIIAQGGAVIFKSQEGKGSVFGFTFAKTRLLPENFKMPAPLNPEDPAE